MIPPVVPPRGLRFRDHRKLQRESSEGSYDWRLYAPRSPRQFLRWLIEGGGSGAEATDAHRLANLQGLASCICLLREYQKSFGMPEGGSVQDQQMVLREITRDLYEGATPLWALEYVMQKAAEGLMGHPHVNWMLLPRKGFMYIPANLTTIMFDMRRGYLIYKMERMGPVAVRLASFASNTVASSSSIRAKFPTPAEFEKARKDIVDTEQEEVPYESAEKLAEGQLCSLVSSASNLPRLLCSRNSQHGIVCRWTLLLLQQ